MVKDPSPVVSKIELPPIGSATNSTPASPEVPTQRLAANTNANQQIQSDYLNVLQKINKKIK